MSELISKKDDNFYTLMFIILENPKSLKKIDENNLERIKKNVSSFDENIDDKTLITVSIFSSLAYNNELLQQLIFDVIKSYNKEEFEKEEFEKEDLKILLGLILETSNIEVLEGGVNYGKIFDILKIIFFSFLTIILFYWTNQSTENSLKKFYKSKLYDYSLRILPYLKDSSLLKTCSISSDINDDYHKILKTILPEKTEEAIKIFNLVSGNLECIYQSPSIKEEYLREMQSYYQPTSALQITDISEKASEKALALIPSTEYSLTEYIEPVKKTMEKAEENFNNFMNDEMNRPNFDKNKLIKSLSKMSEDDIENILKRDNEISSSYYDYAMKIGKSFIAYSLKDPSFSPLKQYAIELHNMFIELNKRISISKIEIESDLSQLKNEISLIKSLIINGLWFWGISYAISAYLMRLIYAYTQKDKLKKIKNDERMKDVTRYNELREIVGKEQYQGTGNVMGEKRIGDIDPHHAALALLALGDPNRMEGGKKSQKKQTKKSQKKQTKKRRQNKNRKSRRSA
jgi:hypothetical protein